MQFKSTDRFRERNIIFLMICFSVLYLSFQLLFLDKIPSVMVDEPWYANVGYNFSIGNGQVNTNPGSGVGTGVFLYTLLMGVFFKGVGTTLFTARLFSVVGGLLGLIGLVCILAELKVRQRVISFCCMLYIFSNVTYVIFRSVRPEGWILTFVIWGGFFLLTAVRSGKEVKFFLAGLFVSASFLCHPNGALYIFLFGIITLVHSWQCKKPRYLMYYLLGCSIVFACFCVNRVYVRKLELFSFVDKWLSRTSLGQDKVSPASVSIGQNFFVFFENYTLGIKRIYIFIFEIVILVVGLFHYKKRAIFITSLLGLCYFLLAIVFLKPFVTRHFGEIIIFSIVSYGLLLQLYENRRIAYIFFCIIGGIYFVNNIAGDAYLIGKNYNKTSYSLVERKIDEIVPDQTKVLTLMHFWFPLKNNDNYNSYTRWRKKDYSSLDELLDSGDLDYVVISNYLTKGVTPTSGRKTKNKTISKYTKHYDKAHSYASANGSLIETVKSQNYGNIEIWQLR